MRRSKNYVSALFVACFILVGIAYAYIESSLSINGTATVDSASWNIHFENVRVIEESVEAIESPSIVDETSLTYNIKLSKPRDFYEFTVDIKNSGSIDGMISDISSMCNGIVIGENKLPTYLRYTVTYLDGRNIMKNDLLKHGTSDTISIRIEFSEDIEAIDLPSSSQTIELSFNLTYRQADYDILKEAYYDDIHAINDRIDELKRFYANGTLNEADRENIIEEIRQLNVEKNRLYELIEEGASSTTAYVVSNTEMYIDQSIPEGIFFRSTAEEAISDWRNLLGIEESPKLFYLKHKLNKDKKIKESYVEFIVTEEMASANTGMRAGTYQLRGGVDESYLEGKIVYESNKDVLLNAFGSDNCDITSLNLTCTVSGLASGVAYNGDISVSDFDSHCSVYWNASSNCL